MKRAKISFLVTLALLVGALAVFAYWMQQNLEPMPSGPKRYIRWERPARIGAVLADLQRRGVIRNSDAARLYAWLSRTPTQVQTGTYEVAPGQTVKEILRELQKPIRQMVRIPETNWARRTANLLEQKIVLRADEYMSLIQQPKLFEEYVSFPLPDKSLEGYLYPDTYDLPPLLGAKEVIVRQLKNFEKKVWNEIGKPHNLHEILIKASLVELEAGTDPDRYRIAGVLENRLEKGMRLQIDAALLYGIQKWRRLTFADYRNIESPYNLYKVSGLPPGPICSPSIKSIRAVMNPAEHEHLYYVALPDGSSLFAETYAQHLQNIQKRRKALRERERAGT